MEKVSSEYAGKLLMTAVESNAVKLLGPGANPAIAAQNAKTDAAYILALLTALTEVQPR